MTAAETPAAPRKGWKRAPELESRCAGSRKANASRLARRALAGVTDVLPKGWNVTHQPCPTRPNRGRGAEGLSPRTALQCSGPALFSRSPARALGEVPGELPLRAPALGKDDCLVPQSDVTRSTGECEPAAQSTGTEQSHVKLPAATQPTQAAPQKQPSRKLQVRFSRLPLVPRSCRRIWREKTVKQLDAVHNGMAVLHGTASPPPRDVPGLPEETVKPDACSWKHRGEERAEKEHMQPSRNISSGCEAQPRDTRGSSAADGPQTAAARPPTHHRARTCRRPPPPAADTRDQRRKHSRCRNKPRPVTSPSVSEGFAVQELTSVVYWFSLYPASAIVLKHPSTPS